MRTGEQQASGVGPGRMVAHGPVAAEAASALVAGRRRAACLGWPAPKPVGIVATALCAVSAVSSLVAEEPYVSYIFPAGGQQGTTVNFKVGGHYLHGEASFEMAGPGVEAGATVREADTVWFEGPLIPMPASQQKEDYPRDHAGHVTLAKDALPGVRYWHVATSQGVTAAARFVVGTLPEIVEEEIDGAPVPVEVSLPVTINGRIFPREDIDIWAVPARRGEVFTCSVNARRLGSPLDARLEVLDPAGNPVAEAVPGSGSDPVLQWQAPADGTYAVKIHDLDFGGLQHHVYRLTISRGPHIATTYPLGARRGTTTRMELLGNDGGARGEIEVAIPEDASAAFPLPPDIVHGQADPVFLQIGDAPEFLEAGTNDSRDEAQADSFPIPCLLNGRIEAPGDRDYWGLPLESGAAIECTAFAGELGSPLLPVMTVFDPAGKEIARSGSRADPKPDARLRIEASESGVYHIEVSEHFPGRGGAHFGYRLLVTRPAGPDFRLTLASDAVSVVRDIAGLTDEQKKARPPVPPAKLVVEVERLGGFAGEIEVVAAGLPEGVQLANQVIAEGQNKTELTFSASPGARIQSSEATLSGKAVIGGGEVMRVAGVAVARGEPPLQEVRVAIAMPAPFHFTGDYNSFPLPRGSVYRRKYRLHRDGFDGPLFARLADRQVRHLQGNRGPTIAIPPGATEFEYGIVLAPCLEIGRTSRSTIMVYGTVTDADGSEHVVSFSSAGQNDQFIGQMVAGLLSVQPLEASLAVARGSSVDVPVVVGRQQPLKDATVQVGLSVPVHFKGVRAEPVTVPAGQASTTLTIHFDEEMTGGFNMPALVTATTLGEQDPHLAEAPLEFITFSGEETAP